MLNMSGTLLLWALKHLTEHLSPLKLIIFFHFHIPTCYLCYCFPDVLPSAKLGCFQNMLDLRISCIHLQNCSQKVQHALLHFSEKLNSHKANIKQHRVCVGNKKKIKNKRYNKKGLITEEEKDQQCNLDFKLFLFQK